MTRVYMDANATTPLLPEVMETMRPYWIERFGNASSIHLDGQQAHSAVDRARATLAEFFNCHDAEVVFNSGGTEGDNTAIFGLLRPGDHFVTTSIEHSAILAAAERMAAFGVETTFVAPTASGLIDPAAIERALRPETRLISVMLDVRHFGCHLCSISAHKMHGPKGVGALFVRRGTPIESLLVGGSHERRRRAGTENVPGIVGLAKAAELAMHSLEDGTLVRLAALRDRLEAGILELPGTGVNGAFVPRVTNTTNIWFDHLEGEALVIALDLKGVAVSGGSAWTRPAPVPASASACSRPQPRPMWITF